MAIGITSFDPIRHIELLPLFITAALLRKLALEIDSHIEPLPFTPQDLDDKYSTLTQEIKKYGVLIY